VAGPLIIEHLSSMFSCGDYIAVHDGTDAMTPLLQQLCDDAYNQTVISTGDRLYVQFVSDDQFEAQGFAAYFRFIPRDSLTTSVAVTTPSYTTGKHKRIQRLSYSYLATESVPRKIKKLHGQKRQTKIKRAKNDEIGNSNCRLKAIFVLLAKVP